MKSTLKNTSKVRSPLQGLLDQLAFGLADRITVDSSLLSEWKVAAGTAEAQLDDLSLLEKGGSRTLSVEDLREIVPRLVRQDEDHVGHQRSCPVAAILDYVSEPTCRGSALEPKWGRDDTFPLQFVWVRPRLKQSAGNCVAVKFDR